MKIITLTAALLGTVPAFAQQVVGVAPGRNANAVAPRATVSASLSAAPAAATTKLSVFSAQAGGRKAGTTAVTGTAVQFTPTTAFHPGELLTAVYTTSVGGAAQAWQFTAAATSGSGQLSLGSTVPTEFDYYSFEGLVRLADVDGDGDLDMLTMGNSQISVSTQLLVKLNDGRGNFTAGWSATIPISNPWTWRCQLEAADIDNDGDLDILCSGNQPFVHVFTNDGKGTFQLKASVLTDTSYRLVVGDVDADGDLDFIETTVGPSSHVFYTFYALGLNDGTGAFTVTHPFANTNFNGTIAGLRDLNNDGALDILEEVPGIPSNTRYTFDLAVRFNSGQGSFGPPQPITTAADSLTSWVCTDFDDDSNLDLLLLTNGCANCAPSLKVLANDGTGHFGPRRTLPATGLGRGSQRLAVADLTGDGRPDLLATSLVNAVQVLPNLGNGTFGPARSYAGATAASTLYVAPMLALGDLNNDGAIDVAAPFYPVNSAPRTTAILLNAPIALATATRQPLATATLWPNPASAANGVLHLALPTPLAAGELSLTTALGQAVRHQAVTGAAAEVPLQGLAPGLYLLTVRSAGQPLRTQRVMIQ